MSDGHFIIEQVAGPPAWPWLEDFIEKFNDHERARVLGARVAESVGRLLDAETECLKATLENGLLSVEVGVRVPPDMVAVEIRIDTA